MRLVLVTGVGTGVGKTHVTAALALAWGRIEPVIAYKPIESGVIGLRGADETLLASYGTFHVKRPLLQVRLRAPVSPHLAAREEGVVLDLAAIARETEALRRVAPVIVELPGGLFSPLSDTKVNADLMALLRPDVTLLVAPNRLGVLHDVRATTEASHHRGLQLAGVVLNAVAVPDESSASNAAELTRTNAVPVLADLPRATIEELAASPNVDGLARRCRLPRMEPPALE